MKKIDLTNWSRKDHYSFFKQLDIPYFNITTDIDISKFYSFIKQEDFSFFKTLLYFVMNTANEIDSFKLRIRDEVIIKHSKISPSFTYLKGEETFNFCYAEYEEDFNYFLKNVEKSINNSTNDLIDSDKEARDDLVYITSIPWVSFKSISHPVNLSPADSVPRISWGKYYKEQELLKLPFSVQVHHALMDGIHVGKYINKLQEKLYNPEEILL